MSREGWTSPLVNLLNMRKNNGYWDLISQRNVSNCCFPSICRWWISFMGKKQTRLATDSAVRVFPGVWKLLSFLRLPSQDRALFPPLLYLFSSFIFFPTFFQRQWAAILGAWCPLPAFRSCFVEFTQPLNISPSYSSAILGPPLMFLSYFDNFYVKFLILFICYFTNFIEFSFCVFFIAYWFSSKWLLWILSIVNYKSHVLGFVY